MPSLIDSLASSGLPSAGPDLFIALDIDGTVLHYDTSLSERVGRAVAAHVEAGTRITLATGRGIYGTQVALEQLQIASGLAVCSNGAITLGLGGIEVPGEPWSDRAYQLRSESERTVNIGLPFRILDYHTFDPRKEIDLLHRAIPNALLAVEELDGPRRVTKEFPPGELTGPNVVLPASELGVAEATRLTVRAPEMSSEELLRVVESLGLNGVEYAVGWSAWLDVSPNGVSKASALDHIRAAYGIDRTATLAVGDGGNDIEMLKWAKLGVAMGGSAANVQAAADATTANVQDDGLADVLEFFL